MNESIHVVGSFILAGILLYGLWQGTRRCCLKALNAEALK